MRYGARDPGGLSSIDIELIPNTVLVGKRRQIITEETKRRENVQTFIARIDLASPSLWRTDLCRTTTKVGRSMLFINIGYMR